MRRQPLLVPRAVEYKNCCNSCMKYPFLSQQHETPRLSSVLAFIYGYKQYFIKLLICQSCHQNIIILIPVHLENLKQLHVPFLFQVLCLRAQGDALTKHRSTQLCLHSIKELEIRAEIHKARSNSQHSVKQWPHYSPN